MPGWRRVIDQRAKPECPSCGANDWGLPFDDANEVNTVVFPLVAPDGTIRRDFGMPAVVYVCNYCGFIRAHSEALLEALEQEAARNN